MSNVKRVNIQGSMPWNAAAMNDIERSAIMNNWLANMNLPCFGIKITWRITEQYYVENKESNGRCCFIPYSIHGDEAVSYESLFDLVDELKRIGKISIATATQMDGREEICATIDLLDPLHDKR